MDISQYSNIFYRELNDLILQNAKYIKSTELQIMLAKASAHFSILVLAHEKKITEKPEDFDDYVYQKDLEAKIEEAINEIEKKVKKLST